MRMTDCADRLRTFYRSRWYPVLAAGLIFCGHVTGWDVPFLAAAILLALPGFFVARDSDFLLPQLMMFVFAVTARYFDPETVDYRYDRYLQPHWIILSSAVLTAVAVGLTDFIRRNRKIANRLRERSIPISLAILSAAMLCNGVFHTPYTPKNLMYAAIFAVSTLGFYLFCARFRRQSRASDDWFLYCVAVTGLLILAELIAAYFTTVRFENGTVVKESVILGWGVWTSVGGMLVFLMPACFRFAYDSRRGWIFYLLGLAMFAGTLISQSRGALLTGGIVLVVCLILVCTGGANRRQNRILTVALLLVGASAAVLLIVRSSGLIRNLLEYGLNDNGRFDLWKIGLRHFLESPIFGSGFYDSYVSEWNTVVYPDLYHNTFVQMLGACGAVGFAAYLWHRAVTVRVILKNRGSVQTRFLAVSIFGLLLFSLIDVLFFKTYPTVIYALMLCRLQPGEEA